MTADKFNIRVYGLLVDDGKILVTDEFRLGILMTKFPGGALEYGEGTLECLKREFLEELNTEITIESHFYTTDYFQPTTLLPSTMQLINIYYIVRAAKPYHFPVTDTRFDFDEPKDGDQRFRWLSLEQVTEEDFTFPIDKKIVPMIKNVFLH